MNISTALSSIGKIGSSVLNAAVQVAPAAASIYATSQMRGGGGGVAMPGGYPSGGALTAGGSMNFGTGMGISNFLPSLAPDPSGGLRSPIGSSFCISPRTTAGGMRYPRVVQFQVAPDQVETYVRAPKVQYRVSVKPRRRRCRGGR